RADAAVRRRHSLGFAPDEPGERSELGRRETHAHRERPALPPARAVDVAGETNRLPPARAHHRTLQSELAAFADPETLHHRQGRGSETHRVLSADHADHAETI